MKHPSGIDQAIVDKMVARRGRLHAYEQLDAAKTALVVIDLDEGTYKRLQQDADASDMIAAINVLAHAVRGYDGSVAWITSVAHEPSENFQALLGTAAQGYEAEVATGEASQIWHELAVREGDIHAIKQGYSAFFPGKSNLHEQLQARSVDTILIAGTVTNVCCESSARDAYELGYKVIMVSDALRGHSYGLHEAALATIFRNFGDVRPSEEVLSLLKSLG